MMFIAVFLGIRIILEKMHGGDLLIIMAFIKYCDL